MPQTGLPRLILAATMLAGLTGPVLAYDARFAGRGYGAPYGYAEQGAVGYGYADEAVRGAYVGAPLTRFPRPSEIVPSPWSYGTYGIPTVTGIPRAPVGTPTITVINADRPAARSPRNTSARVINRGRDGAWSQADTAPVEGGPRIISVSVPRR
ncbi:hypothetical protein [Methylobacterium sp. A54F]